MKESTRLIINMASAGKAKILVTKEDIRLRFANGQDGIRFLEEISEACPSLRMTASQCKRSIDMRLPEACAA